MICDALDRVLGCALVVADVVVHKWSYSGKREKGGNESEIRNGREMHLKATLLLVPLFQLL